MIMQLGDNLHVLLLATTSQDWEAFGSWYSVTKNLPYSAFSLCYFRQKDITPFQMFQWAKRLELHHFALNDQKDDLVNRFLALRELRRQQPDAKNVLMINASVMTVDELDEKLCKLLNQSSFLMDEAAWFCSMESEDIDAIYSKYQLTRMVPAEIQAKICFEAKETVDTTTLISYEKGCGSWIHTMKGCPFANATGLATDEMTISETRVLELWRKMVILYNAVC